jgi:hypothetical protein
METALKQIHDWAAELEALCERLAPRFGRVEVRRRASGFLHGLLSGAERKNGSSVVKEAASGQVAAVWFDRCWSATMQRYTTSDSRRFRHRSASLGDLPSAILRR